MPPDEAVRHDSPGSAASPGYAELHCISNFTFLRGASHPEELIERAARLGYRALAITDECSLAGIVRAHMAAVEHGIKLIAGAEFRLQDGLHFVLLATSRRGYAQLCELITLGRRSAPKGQYLLGREHLMSGLNECLLLWLPDMRVADLALQDGLWLQRFFAGRIWLAAELLCEGDHHEKITAYRNLAVQVGLRVVACGGVHMHVAERRVLQDTLTAIRLGVPVGQAGLSLHSNGERYLRSARVLQHHYPADWLTESLIVAGRANFSLSELEYQYPSEVVPKAQTAASWLRILTERGIQWRWPDGVTAKVRQQIEHELELIAELQYESYFLTVHDIVWFARDRGILCQGRGSAANSAVCYCLGITEVDPSRMNMLVERFISKERNEPPDIDVDFEHERREEVIQYIYRKYGRLRAALTATVITYRVRSAIRDVGRVLGLSDLQASNIARSMQWWDGRQLNPDRVREAGLDPDNPLLSRMMALVEELLGFPRHLSQHVGGFLIAEQPLTELVPIENAAMPDRTVIQWDKTDLDDLGLLKVDVLGLGMLTVLHRCFDLLKSCRGRDLTMATLPPEDPDVYAMISRGDTVGVFQIESRAQMAMLPRLRPSCYYDLVIEVAIIRPGPIQGDMVHPYLRRRNGEEPVSYPSAEVQEVLERTLGVPIFQEQVMQLAIVAAGFSPGEADQLRRAMAAWKRRGGLGSFEKRLADGMRERGYNEVFARQIFQQIKGFGEYGFPESHAASFALLVYVSAWLKFHEPAIFACALLNSQPMGFYAPAQIVQAARKQGVEIRSAEVNRSNYDCSLESSGASNEALRLGLRMIKGLSSAGAQSLVKERGSQPYASVQEIAARVPLSRQDHSALAAADALREVAGNRHLACWDVAGVEAPLPLYPAPKFSEALPLLRSPTVEEAMVADYASTGVSLRPHPLALIRPSLEESCLTAADLWRLPDKSRVLVAGLVITRQRPGSAANVTFVTLEDETGFINLVVWERIAERQRKVLLGAKIVAVYGETQKQDGVLHVIVRRMVDKSSLLSSFSVRSRSFR